MSVPLAGEPTRIWCEQVHNAAKGATGGTFDNLGSITIKSPADEGKWHKIIAILVNSVLSIPTSGQNGVSILRVRSDDLGITNQDIPLQSYTDAIATNDKELQFVSTIIPFFLDPTRSTRNTKMFFDLSANVTMTGGHDTVVGLMYGNASPVPGTPFYNEIMGWPFANRPSRWFRSAESDGGIDAASLTAFSDKIEKTSQARLLTALSGFVNGNGPTANEAIVGYTNYAASQIEDFQPQNWPFTLGTTASLGTPVGTTNMINVPYWPTRYDLPLTTFDITPSQDLVVALTNAGDGVVAAKFR